VRGPVRKAVCAWPLNSVVSHHLKHTIAMFVACALIGACAAEDKCSYFSERHEDDALKYHLSKNNVPFKATGDSICVSARDAAELKEAEAQIQRYFREVAYLLADSCEEQAFVEWAKKANLRYHIAPVLDSRYQPSGNMFFLRSFTHEEVLANRERLANDAPKSTRCRKDK
jgi:hypothetical protein